MGSGPDHAQPFDAYLPTCSGAAGTILDRALLDFEGRRFLGSALVGTATAPIRVYAGTAHGDATERAARAVAELVRLGAAGRRRLVIGAPTGRGWVDHVLLRAIEAFTDGDVAAVASQFGTRRSVSSSGRLEAAVTSFVALLDAVERSPELQHVPRIVVGESFGAWTLARALQRIAERPPDALGLVGTPGVARLDDHEALLSSLEDAGVRLGRFERHDDPVVAFPGASLGWRPSARWRAADRRPWWPVLTLRRALAAIDRATRLEEPRTLDASRHDYRTELPAVAAALLGDVAPGRLAEVRSHLVALERDQSTWWRCYGPAPCVAWPGPAD